MDTLIAIWHWLGAHWGAVILVLGGLATILNAATRIWSDHPKAVRWLSWFISVVSVVRSRGADDGALGALKLPGLPEKAGPPSGIVKAVFPFLLLAGAATATLGASGCATWQQTTKIALDSAQNMAIGGRQIAEPRFVEECRAVAKKCGADKTPDCPALVDCQGKQHKFNLGLISLHTTCIAGYSAISAADKIKAQSYAKLAADLVQTATATLRALGVLP